MLRPWEDVRQRGVDTCAVWNQYNAALTVGQLTLAEHRANVQSLAALAQVAADAEDEYDQAVDAKDDSLQFIADVNVRGLAVLRGSVERADSWHVELEAVSGMVNKGSGKVLARARALTVAWSKVNAARAAMSPALPPVMAGATAVGDLNAAVVNHEARLQAVTEKLSEWNAARGALLDQARKVDGNNKRWYVVWSGFYAAGSPEYAAREQIKTEPSGRRAKAVALRSETELTE